MEFLGDNSAYGAQRVELSGERFVDVVEAGEGDGFPFDVCGLLPVVTSRKKKGGVKVVYALPFGPEQPAEDNRLAKELRDATSFVNLLLSEASECSEHAFPSIEGLWIGVPEKGYAFTRVEEVPLNGSAANPIHLRLETSAKASAPGSLSAVLEFDPEGYLQHVLVTEFGENGYVCRMTAAVDFRDGEVRVQKVVETQPGEEPYELYFWRRYSVGGYDGEGGWD